MTDPIPTAEQVRARIEKWLACEFQNLPVYGGRPTRLAKDADSLYVDVVAPLLERLAILAEAERKFDERLSDLQAEYRKHLDSWDRTRKRLEAERNLVRWLHAEQVWLRERERCKGCYEDAGALVDAKAEVDLLRWLHAEAQWYRDMNAQVLGDAVAENQMLRWLHAEAVWQWDSERASRQDWAVEADRLEHELEQAQAALYEIGYDPAAHAWAPDSRSVMESMLSEYSEMLRGMARRASELRRALDDAVAAFGVATAIGKRTRRRRIGLRAEVESLRAQLTGAVVLPDDPARKLVAAIDAEFKWGFAAPNLTRMERAVRAELNRWRVSPDTPLAAKRTDAVGLLWPDMANEGDEGGERQPVDGEQASGHASDETPGRDGSSQVTDLANLPTRFGEDHPLTWMLCRRCNVIAKYCPCNPPNLSPGDRGRLRSWVKSRLVDLQAKSKERQNLEITGDRPVHETARPRQERGDGWDHLVTPESRARVEEFFADDEVLPDGGEQA